MHGRSRFPTIEHVPCSLSLCPKFLCSSSFFPSVFPYYEGMFRSIVIRPVSPINAPRQPPPVITLSAGTQTLNASTSFHPLPLQETSSLCAFPHLRPFLVPFSPLPGRFPGRGQRFELLPPREIIASLLLAPTVAWPFMIQSKIDFPRDCRLIPPYPYLITRSEPTRLKHRCMLPPRLPLCPRLTSFCFTTSP